MLTTTVTAKNIVVELGKTCDAHAINQTKQIKSNSKLNNINIICKKTFILQSPHRHRIPFP